MFHWVCVSVCLFSMITLKVLNSIVLLGKSCMYVKEANMEEKLFQNPPSAAPSRVSSRANRTKHTREPPGNTQETLKTEKIVLKSLIKVFSHWLIVSTLPLKVSQRRRACLLQSPLNPPKGMNAPPLSSPPANQISSLLHQMNQKIKALFRTILNLNTGRPKKTCWRLTALLSAVTVSTDINTHPQVLCQVCTEMPTLSASLIRLTFELELVGMGQRETAGYLLISDAPNLFKT